MPGFLDREDTVRITPKGIALYRSLALGRPTTPMGRLIALALQKIGSDNNGITEEKLYHYIVTESRNSDLGRIGLSEYYLLKALSELEDEGYVTTGPLDPVFYEKGTTLPSYITLGNLRARKN